MTVQLSPPTDTTYPLVQCFQHKIMPLRFQASMLKKNIIHKKHLTEHELRQASWSPLPPCTSCKHKK